MIIGAQFVLLIIFAAFIGYQFRELTARDHKTLEVQQSLQLISDTHKEEWEAHNLALANAMLILDAYQAGGLDKAAEVYDESIKGVDVAEVKKDRIKAELEKFGISTPDDPPPTHGT